MEPKGDSVSWAFGRNENQLELIKAYNQLSEVKTGFGIYRCPGMRSTRKDETYRFRTPSQKYWFLGSLLTIPGQRWLGSRSCGISVRDGNLWFSLYWSDYEWPSDHLPHNPGHLSAYENSLKKVSCIHLAISRSWLDKINIAWKTLRD